MDMDVLGKRIRNRRKQLGLSQMDMAKRTGIIQGDISLLERGKKHALWVETLERLAATLGCSLDYLVGRTDDPASLRPPPPAKRSRPRKTAPVG